MKMHWNLHRADIGNHISRCFYQWWAVEVSNLRPQQCECQKEAANKGASLESRQVGTAQNGTREQLFAPDLHTPKEH